MSDALLLVALILAFAVVIGLPTWALFAPPFDAKAYRRDLWRSFRTCRRQLRELGGWDKETRALWRNAFRSAMAQVSGASS